jgi:putative colanic acid biosynthesis glycosyltransferase WcaI
MMSIEQQSRRTRRILLWSPNYAPEPNGIPPLATDAAEWLVERGHSVDVVTAVPNYPERRIHPDYRGVFFRSETVNGVRVHRSWLRARPERSFADKALYELTISTFALPNASRLARRADVIVCVVPTLLAATYAACLARTLNKRLVLWVQDLVLSAAASVGVGPAASRVLSATQRLEQIAVRAADTVVVCSSGFRDYLVEGGADPRRIVAIHNWANVDEIAPSARTVNGWPVRFLYAGNLGYTQGFETLFDAARIGGDSIAVEIVGAGNASESVRSLSASVPNVTVRAPVERRVYPDLLASADVQLVLQRRISAGANLPSKIATSMASGRPLLASIESGTPAADLLRASRGALLVEPESPPLLADGMRRLAADPDLRAQLGANARAYAERHLAKRPALARLEAAIVG